MSESLCVKCGELYQHKNHVHFGNDVDAIPLKHYFEAPTPPTTQSREAKADALRSGKFKTAAEKYPDCEDCRKENIGGNGYVLCNKHYGIEHPPRVFTKADIADALRKGAELALEAAAQHALRRIWPLGTGSGTSIFDCTCGKEFDSNFPIEEWRAHIRALSVDTIIAKGANEAANPTE